MTKGFALNDERFINGNKYDTKYFNELLERREELFNENFKLAESREFKWHICTSRYCLRICVLDRSHI